MAEETAGIVDLIAAGRATTLEGLKVKARAFAWCRVGEPLDADDLRTGRLDLTTDMRVLIGLMADLSAIGDAA